MLRLQSKPSICRIIRIYNFFFSRKASQHFFAWKWVIGRCTYIYAYIYIYTHKYNNIFHLLSFYSMNSDLLILRKWQSTLRRCFQCQRWCQPRCLKIYHHWMQWPKSKTLERWISFSDGTFVKAQRLGQICSFGIPTFNFLLICTASISEMVSYIMTHLCFGWV